VSKSPEAARPDGGSPPAGTPPTASSRWIAAFGHFWWDFLIGDTPELLAGAVLAVGVVALLAHNGVARAVTVGSMPVLVTALLLVSVRRARRAQRVQRVQRVQRSRAVKGGQEAQHPTGG